MCSYARMERLFLLAKGYGGGGVARRMSGTLRFWLSFVFTVVSLDPAVSVTCPTLRLLSHSLNKTFHWI